MKPLETRWIVLLVLAAASPAQVERPASRPTSRPSEVKTVHERVPHAKGSDAALELARRVRTFAQGRDGWARTRNLVFTFAGRRRLFWDRRANKVRIETIARPGRRPGQGAAAVSLVYDIKKDRAVRLGGVKGRGDPTRQAKGIWINDTYWLLVTLKLLDPGVELSIDPPKQEDADGVARLRLRFASVGLTPQNEYLLHVEKKTGKVLRWDYFGTARTKPRSWRFAGYAKVGPLRLSLRRPPVGKGFAIELTDVAANVKAPADIWTREDSTLAGLK